MAPAAVRESIVAFLHAVDRAAAGRVESVPVAGGDGRDSGARAWAVTDAERPRVWDANHLYVAGAGAATAADLVAAAERALSALGGAHGGVIMAAEAEGAARQDGFALLGWHCTPNLLMVHRDPARLAASAGARRVSEEEAEPARRALILGESWGSEPVARQLLSRGALVAARAGGTSYGAEHEGAVASSCVVLRGENIAQVENVGTVPAARGLGLATAVVSLATARAREAAELVFLCADPADWPRHLYARLGYEPIGLLYRFSPVFGFGAASPDQG